MWGSEDHLAVEGGGGGGGGGEGVIGDFRKKTSCRMISKEKISALKKKSHGV